MIRDDKAYVDDTPSEEMKQQRENKQPSKCRDNSMLWIYKYINSCIDNIMDACSLNKWINRLLLHIFSYFSCQTELGHVGGDEGGVT